MAIDFDAIRKKLERLNGNNRNRSTMWKPEEGEEYSVRLLSFPDNDGQPFKERWFYYNIPGQRGILAPYQFGKPDPIQELINKLKEEGSKESYELCKKLYPKMRTYAAVVVRGQEDKGVQLWAFGKMVYQTLLGIMLDEDYGDITDPLEGRDIKVICTKQPGKQWATTEIRPRGKSTKLNTKAKESKAWIDNIPTLDGLFTMKTYEELEKIVNDWLNGDEEEGETERNTSSDKTPDKNYTSLDAAFNDLVD